MRLFTRKGDTGQTDLLGERVTKDDPRIALIGVLDETTSSLGLARSHATDPRLNDWSIDIQRDLYKIMAELAFTDELRPAGYHIGPERIDWLESITDEISNEVDLPPEFIVPGDTPQGAFYDLARTIVRRAERTAVELANRQLVGNAQILRYLNRLSSFAFVAARLEDHRHGLESTRAHST